MRAKSEMKPTMDGGGMDVGGAKFLSVEMLNELGKTAHNLQEKAVHLSEDASAYMAKIKDKSLEIENKVTMYAKQNPLKTIGISMVCGALLVKMFRIFK